jgi:hypothetical protein
MVARVGQFYFDAVGQFYIGANTDRPQVLLQLLPDHHASSL